MIRRVVRRLIPPSTRAAMRRGGRRAVHRGGAAIKRAGARLFYAGWSRKCPVCGSRLRRFRAFRAKPEALCPVCGSLERQRLYWLYLREKLSDSRTRSILHMAPEPGLARRLRSLPGVRYVGADPCNPVAELKFELSAIPFDADTFDVIIISHVLQHVWDERAALLELRRVLKPDGWMLTNESFQEGPTVETLSPATAGQAKTLNGYYNETFVRRYGTDYGERLRRYGLAATYIPFGDRFDAAQRRRMGLGRPKNFYIATKIAGPVPASSDDGS